MIPNNFSSILSFVQTSGYLLIFLLMVIEGPFVTSVAAFASSLGYLNVWIIFLLSLLGDITSDFLYFLMGKILKRSTIEKYLKKIGINDIKKLEKRMHEHLGKTMLIMKFTPPIGTVGIALAGTLKIPIKRFLLFSFVITLPRTLFFVLFGYYAGIVSSNIMKYFDLSQYILLFVVIFILISYFVFRKISSAISKSRIQKNKFIKFI